MSCLRPCATQFPECEEEATSSPRQEWLLRFGPEARGHFHFPVQLPCALALLFLKAQAWVISRELGYVTARWTVLSRYLTLRSGKGLGLVGSRAKQRKQGSH